MDNAGSTHEGQRLFLFDGLRGLAAIGVVLFHARGEAFTSLMPRGYLFVDLFFLLSGFVLTLSFEHRFRSGLAPHVFLIRRYRRFAPLTVTGAALGLIVLTTSSEAVVPGLVMLLYAAAFIPFIHGTALFPLNTPQWSLLQELVLNLLHALILGRLGNRSLLVIAAGGALYMGWSMALRGTGDIGAFPGELAGGLARGLWSYPLGIVIARQWRGDADRKSILDWKLSLAALVLPVALLPLLPVPKWMGDLAVIVLAFPPLFWIAARARLARGAEKPMAALGAISFPLYAIHVPILFAGRNWLGDTGTFAAIAAALLLAAALARLTARHPAKARQIPAQLAADA